MDLSLRYTYVSPAITRMRGYSVEEIVGTTIQETMTPASIEAARKGLAEELAAERTGQADPLRSRKIELEMYCKDGTTIWTEMNTTFLRDSDGRPIGILGVTRDITERKQMEQALSARMEEYVATTNLTGDVMAKIDHEGRWTFLNDSACQFFGKQRERLLGTDAGASVHPEDLEPTVQAILEARERKEPITGFVNRQITPTGTRAVEWNAYPLFDEQGRYAGIQMTGRDITERRQAEEALGQAEQRYRELFEEAPAMYVICRNQDGAPIVADCNELFLSTVGYARDEVVGRPVADFYTPESRAQLVEGGGFQRALTGEFFAEERQLLTRDGRIVETVLHAAPELDAEGQVLGTRAMYVDITQRKQAEEALDESERRYRLLAENTSDLIWTMDLSLRYTYMSPAVTRMRGYSVEEIVGTTVQETMTPASLEVARKALTEELALERDGGADPNRSRKLELEMYCKDGSTIWTEMNMTFLRDADDRPIGILGVTRDISERKQAEAALRTKDSAIASSITAIALADLEGTVTYVNPSLLKMWGFDDEEEALGRNVSEFWQTREKALEVGRALRDRGSWAGELVAIKRDGSPFHVEMVVSTVSDEAGNPICIMGSFLDISERKQAEKALEEGEKRYRLLAESASDIIWTMDMNLRYTYESPAVTRIRGYTPEEAMAQTIEETLTPASLELARKALAEELTARKMAKDLSRFRTLELEHTCKDGSTVWLEVTTTFLRDDDGRPVGLLGASRDISERKRAEEERKRLHAELETRAVTDSLTGLYNHAHFYQRLAEEIDRAKRYGHRFALVMMDLDAFKHYNDSRGHQAGDEALHLVGECIRSAMRHSDMAFRYGGDEFVTILLNADVSKAQAVVRRINRRIATRLKEMGDSAGAWLGVSAGIACFPEDATTVDELVGMADAAMYDAKRLAWARGVMGRAQAVESGACPVETVHETQTRMLSGAANSLAAALQDLTAPDVVAESDLRTIAALGAAAEIKDPFIRGHQERTSRLAATLANEMGLSPDRVRSLTTAGLLHDLGKVSVSEGILNKPGKLTESEFAKMKEHPALGATMIVSGAEALQPLAPIVRHHHERVDGSGYPDGLARENIPLEARILSVADAFDAMTHERAYRKALSTEEALGEIQRGAGTRFDSGVVEAFLGVVRRRGGEPG
jgi:diguanylate cyclase (GGDEF)-like protein/PAS domain S-box-containing protein